jgi:hypothetical protein
MQAVQVTEQKSKINSCNNHLKKEMGNGHDWTRVTYLRMLSHDTGHYIYSWQNPGMFANLSPCRVRLKFYVCTCFVGVYWFRVCCAGCQPVIRQTEDRMLCRLIWQSLIIHKLRCMMFLPFVTTHFNTAVLTVHNLFQWIKESPPAWQASSFTLLLLYRSVLGSVKPFLLLN